MATCTACHASSEFTAAPFRRRWETRNAQDLYRLVSATMPEDAPNSLAPESYVDIVQPLSASVSHATLFGLRHVCFRRARLPTRRRVAAHQEMCPPGRRSWCTGGDCMPRLDPPAFAR